VQMPFVDGRSRVQQPNPFPVAPLPYMRVTNSHREPDGSTLEGGWDCAGSH